MELIYCAGGNQRFAQIAIDAGFKYGSQLPATVYHPVHFADQDWRKPDRERYMAALNKHRPQVATVLDLESEAQLSEVLGWAEDAAQFVGRVIVIPKANGVISMLPRQIAGAEIVLGYSVPTSYGGTELGLWDFDGWPVHLLGGSPHAQMRLRHYLRVVSADGNMSMKMATSRCQFWAPGNARAKDRFWPKLQEADGVAWSNDAPYEAFRRSCENIAAAWHK